MQHRFGFFTNFTALGIGQGGASGARPLSRVVRSFFCLHLQAEMLIALDTSSAARGGYLPAEMPRSLPLLPAPLSY